MRIDDPVQVFLALVRAVGPTLHPAEESGVPFDTFVDPLGRLLPLTVLDLGLLIRGRLVVPGDNGLDSAVP